MAKSKARSVFVCQTCGAQRPRWEGRCTDCGAWNSFLEENIGPVAQAPASSFASAWTTGGAPPSSLISLDQEIKENQVQRLSTGSSELDRVLGGTDAQARNGGLVPGSFVLLGGEPGVGKSTLLLQMAGGLAANGAQVLYVSGEESVAQSGLRAQRLGIREKRVKMAGESNLHSIQQLVKSEKPQVLIVDSIQTVFNPDLPSAPGSVSQVRDCAAQIMALAKTSGISAFLIGHVTKEGTLAGPKTLEHMVDAVLSFESDSSHQFRLLRAIKNRFGATHELGVFQMESSGLKPILNPSELFLEERDSSSLGSAVFSSMEGSRSILCEVQALSTPTPMPMPRRTAIGIDINRVHLLIAVLTRHLGLKLTTSDVFINVVGGLNLEEPAVDLAVAAALISTETGVETKAKTCFFGEIGLTGEIRAVPFADLRIKEAEKLGFDRFVLPAANERRLGDLSPALLKKCIWLKNVGDLLGLFGSNRAPRAANSSAPTRKPSLPVL